MKKNLRYTAISKGLLTFGMAIGLSFSSGMAAAAGQIVVATNDTVVKTGEEFSAIVALNGDGRYDVYVGITGGAFGTNIFAFDASGLIPWVPTEGPPVKLRDNVDLASLSVKDKVIKLFPRLALGNDYAGIYSIYAILSAPGQFQQQLQDGTLIIDGPLNIEVK
jgi:hypothetical protein